MICVQQEDMVYQDFYMPWIGILTSATILNPHITPINYCKQHCAWDILDGIKGRWWLVSHHFICQSSHLLCLPVHSRPTSGFLYMHASFLPSLVKWWFVFLDPSNLFVGFSSEAMNAAVHVCTYQHLGWLCSSFKPPHKKGVWIDRMSKLLRYSGLCRCRHYIYKCVKF